MIYLDNLCYHVYNRGAHKAPIFWLDKHYEFCINRIKINAEKYRIALLAYCFMPNHYHLLLQQEENGSISKFLQATFIAYTQFVNTREGHSGTLFQGRARSRLIDSEAYGIIAAQCIHLNPVSAKLVKRPEEWKFSDYREWITFDTLSHNRLIQKTKTSFIHRYFTTGYEYQQHLKEAINEQELQKWNEIFEENPIEKPTNFRKVLQINR